MRLHEIQNAYKSLGGVDITCLDYSTDMMERAKRQEGKGGCLWIIKNISP